MKPRSTEQIVKEKESNRLEAWVWVGIGVLVLLAAIFGQYYAN
jgi:hypothetical protein